jgi:hypothetical protein
MHYGPGAIVQCMHDYTLYPYEPLKDKNDEVISNSRTNLDKFKHPHQI